MAFERPTIQGKPPVERQGHRAVHVGNAVYVIGGESMNTLLMDVHALVFPKQLQTELAASRCVGVHRNPRWPYNRGLFVVCVRASRPCLAGSAAFYCTVTRSLHFRMTRRQAPALIDTAAADVAEMVSSATAVGSSTGADATGEDNNVEGVE